MAAFLSVIAFTFIQRQRQLYVCGTDHKIVLYWIFCFCSGRYRIEYDALSKVEAEQNEFIDQFILQKWVFLLSSGWKYDAVHLTHEDFLIRIGTQIGHLIQFMELTGVFHTGSSYSSPSKHVSCFIMVRSWRYMCNLSVPPYRFKWILFIQKENIYTIYIKALL